MGPVPFIKHQSIFPRTLAYIFKSFLSPLNRIGVHGLLPLIHLFYTSIFYHLIFIILSIVKIFIKSDQLKLVSIIIIGNVIKIAPRASLLYITSTIFPPSTPHNKGILLIIIIEFLSNAYSFKSQTFI